MGFYIDNHNGLVGRIITMGLVKHNLIVFVKHNLLNYVLQVLNIITIEMSF